MLRRIDTVWIVVGGCFLVTVCSSLVMWSFGVFFPAVQADLGGSRSAVSSVYTMLIAANASASMLTGKLSDKGHAGIVLQFAIIVGAGAIALCSRAQSLAQLALFLAAVGLATGSTLPAAFSTVQRVFHTRQHAGLALAIVSSGIGLGALVFTPMLNHLILMIGWRNAFLAASSVFFTLLTFAWAAIRHGRALRLRDKPAQHGSPEALPSAISLLFSREFAALALISFITITARQVVFVHLVPLASDMGVAQAVAALALGLMGGLSIPGRLACGLLSDIIRWEKTVRISVIGTAVAVLLLPLGTRDWVLIALVAVFGFWHGARAVGVMGLIGHMFHMRSVGQLVGTIIGVAQLVSALGPYVAGLLYDYSGSYTAIFVGLGVTLLLLSFTVPRVPVVAQDR